MRGLTYRRIVAPLPDRNSRGDDAIVCRAAFFNWAVSLAPRLLDKSKKLFHLQSY